MDAVLTFVDWMTENSYMGSCGTHPNQAVCSGSPEFKALPYRPDAAQAETVVISAASNVLEIETALNEEVQAVTAGVRSGRSPQTLEQIISGPCAKRLIDDVVPPSGHHITRNKEGATI